jgi:hypothetical protein
MSSALDEREWIREEVPELRFANSGGWWDN